jgi:hypothetical protein
MTPKEKADELIDKMYYIGRYDDKEDYNPAMAWERAKQCSLIAVDEILDMLIGSIATIDYWQEVKQEIEKI